MHRSIALSLLGLLAATAVAAPKTFRVVSDKLQYRNLATVESTTEFETFTGKTTNVTGTLTFDPSARTGSGKLSVDLASIDTGIAARNDHMRSSQWLDTEKHPLATFQTTRVAHVSGDNYRVTGQFSLHGVTRTLTTTARVRYRAESAETKQAGFSGDVIHILTKFDIKLADYGVKIPDIAKGKVSPTVTITVSAYATTS